MTAAKQSLMVEYSIDQIHQMFESGDITAEQLTKDYLDRIEQLDRNGPELNAVIEINPDALTIAKELDREYQNNGKTGNLHGIPVLIKDNLDTADKMKTTAGSVAIEKYGGKPEQDSFVVKQLRKAGAIILGKTNLSEMANFRGQNSVSGWSSRGGRTKNPYVLDRNPSGSSSGSAVAVAANFCTVAIGTETDGSVISPSQTNGIVGIKPSIGLVSRSGIIPIAHSQDTAGPMARNVKDAAILLEVITGQDPEDPVTETASDIDQNYTANLGDTSLKGKRLGILRKNLGFHPKVDQIINSVIKEMEEAGAEVVDVEMEYPEEWGSQEFNVLLYEYKFGLNKYFASRKNSEIHDIDDLIQYNKENEEITMPFFGQEHVESAASKGDLDEAEYTEAMAAYEVFRENLTKLLDENELDALIGPSGGPAWVTDLVNGDAYGGGTSQFAAVSGFTSITIPAGYIHGLPIGLSFIGRRFDDKKIIQLGYAFEQLNPDRRHPPEFIETISG